MSRLRSAQLVGIILLLLAGYLWSHKLAEQRLRAELEQIANQANDQLALVREKINEKDDPVELVNLGRTLLDTNNPRSAIIAFERTTELQPGFRDAWYLLGYSYARAAIEPASGLSLAQQQEYLSRAVEALEQVRTLDPNHQPALELLEQLER